MSKQMIKVTQVKSIHGRLKKNTVFAIGKSILNRTSKVNIGELCLEYEGGGHENAGTCQVPNDCAQTVLFELITRITGESPTIRLAASA